MRVNLGVSIDFVDDSSLNGVVFVDGDLYAAGRNDCLLLTDGSFCSDCDVGFFTHYKQGGLL